MNFESLEVRLQVHRTEKVKRKSRQIVGVQLPCGAKAQSLNIIIRIASPNIAEQVLTFYG